MPHFNGFSPEALKFLWEVKINNSKTWYEINKPNYQEYLLKPFQYLVSDLSEYMFTIDPQFVTTPAVGKTISRLYRDTRFTKDKSIFRDSMWLTFKRLSENWQEAPAYFFEITPAGYRFGMGFYNASKDLMDLFRRAIDEKPEEFLKVTEFYRQGSLFNLEGEQYKRTLVPDQPEQIQIWYQRKSFALISNQKCDNQLFNKELIEELTSGFGMLAPLYHYLWQFYR